jgi:membrane-bound ClpP family serine protease
MYLLKITCIIGNFWKRSRKGEIVKEIGLPQMDKKIGGWSSQIVVRYTLLQLPAIGLLLIALVLVQRWVVVSDWIFWCSIIAWITKDVILFPFTWRAYDWESADENRSMLGARGLTKERLAPSGFIQIRGELWKAEVWGGGRPIEKGERVEVREMRGLTLVVQQDEEHIIDEKIR